MTKWAAQVQTLEELIGEYKKADGSKHQQLSQAIMDTVRFWYLVNDDVTYISKKSVLVKFSNKQSFWLPKRYIEVQDNYWKVNLPLDGLIVHDLDGRVIHFLPLWKKFGDKGRANDEEMPDFEAYRHKPPYLKPLKGAKADDRLKR